MSSELHKSKFSFELALILIATALGIAMSYWVLDLGLTRSLTDQNAHLNSAKLSFDSMTPGISQLGFWPPLLHILMIPFTLFESLYETGLAGAFILVPALALAAVFLYRITLMYTNDRALSFIAGLLLILNPYILYYSVTPMMEVLFLANLFGVAYFLALWLKDHRLSHLLASGFFITLASLSRFEGLILIPLCGLIVLIELVRRRKQYSEIEAVMLLFMILAGIGLSSIMIYSWVFSGNPLTFTGGTWIRNTAEATFATKQNLFNSVNYMLHASFYMLSKPLVMLSGISFALFAVLSGQRFHSVAVLAVLFSPFVFIATTLYTGTGSLAVANLPPFDFFSNERYSLTWIGFVILTPLLLIGALTYFFTKSKNAWSWHMGLMLRNTLALSLLALVVVQLYQVSMVDKFAVIRANINSPLPSQIGVINYFQDNYDYGKILITKSDNDPVLAQAEVDLEDYIYEGNFRYFEQTNDEPWLFARYVVMHNPKANDPWSLQNESVMRKWGNSAQFLSFYDLVLENDLRRVYKINDAKIMAMVARNNLNPTEIPSINPQVSWWDPANIYAKIQNNTPVGLR